MSNVGVVGIGNMGGAMARNLLKSGYSVVVCDVVKTAVDDLVSAGAAKAESPAELAKSCDTIVVMVIDDKQATEVVAGPEGILGEAQPGTVVLLCSSLRPKTVTSLASLAKAQGVSVLDGPVTGGEQGAIDGKLTFLVGGDGETLEGIRPVLAAMGEHIVSTGPLGTGQVVKNVHNVLLWTTLAATREALGFAAQFGLEPEAVRDALQFTPAFNRWVRDWGNLGPAPWLRKDLETTLAVASEDSIQMPFAALSRELLKDWPGVRAQEEPS